MRFIKKFFVVNILILISVTQLQGLRSFYKVKAHITTFHQIEELKYIGARGVIEDTGIQVIMIPVEYFDILREKGYEMEIIKEKPLYPSKEVLRKGLISSYCIRDTILRYARYYNYAEGDVTFDNHGIPGEYGSNGVCLSYGSWHGGRVYYYFSLQAGDYYTYLQTCYYGWGSGGDGTERAIYNWDTNTWDYSDYAENWEGWHCDIWDHTIGVYIHPSTYEVHYLVECSALEIAHIWKVRVIYTYCIAVPDIRVVPTSISVTLAQGEQTERTIYIYNDGDATLNWSISDPPVDWLDVSPTSGSVPPGGHQTVTLYFNASGLSGGSYSTTLQVLSNDPDEPTVPVFVTMTVQVPDIRVQPTSISVSLPQGEQTTRTIYIYNDGDATLN